MVLDEIEIPRFSELKPAVLDSAVRKNPAKWRERNKRRAESRRAARRSSFRKPSWEVPQVATVDVESKDIDLKKPTVKAQPSPPPPDVVSVDDVDGEGEDKGGDAPRGQTMPGGYYVRSMEEAHRQTMRAFNVRLCRPYQRPVRPDEEEELPPLEPAEVVEELPKATSSLPSRAARLAAERLRQSQELVQEEQKKRQEDEAQRRREAERRRERRLLEEKIRKLREEQEAQEQARREAEQKQKEVEEAIKHAERVAEEKRKTKAEKEKNTDKEDALRLRRQKDAEDDAMLREERRRRRQQEEAARKEREAQRRKEEEEKRREREREEQRRRKEREEKRAEEERRREAERQAEEERAAEELRRLDELEAKVETEEEARRREEVEKEERRKRAELRRREIKEKADRAKKAAAAGLPPSAAAAAAAAALEREALPAEVQVTVAVLGHQGSGKSTLVGALMLTAGAISERELMKRRKELEREACEELQREDGLRSPSGVEFTLLDVPGGRRCLPQAVQAAAEADIALLVVSAKGRELEAALREASGTSALAEQLRVAKGLGARKLLVAVTKMEDVSWSQDRFDEVATALTPKITNAGFSQAAAIFVPVDGYSNQLDGKKATWHSAGSLLHCLDEAATSEDTKKCGALEVLLFESFATNAGKGLRVRGRIEQGVLEPGQRCQLLPGESSMTIEALQSATRQPMTLKEAKAGQNVEIQLNGQLPDWPSTAGATGHAWRGSVLCNEAAPVQVSDYVKAQMEVIEMPRPLTAGFKAVLHVHAATVEAEIEKIQDAFDWATGVTTEKPKVVKAGQRLTVMIRLSREVPLCASQGSRLGMLMLRSEETTVAIGHILEVQ